MSNPEQFDFVRYFTRVQASQSWFSMMVGLAEYAGILPPKNPSSQKILDLGCGPGRLVWHLENAGVTAIGADNDPKMVAQAQSLYPNQTFVVSRAETLDFPDNHFDAVVSANLLFFLPDPLAALRDMVRVTKPSGTVALWNPSEKMSVAAMQAYVAENQDTLDEFEQKHLPNWANVGENNRRWGADDLQVLFENAGMIDTKSTLLLGGLARYVKGTKP
jgi:ubiquinone/menaquinone biosynthesis C-methylase UbiE